MPIEISQSEEIDSILNASNVSVVEVYTEWCPTCKAITIQLTEALETMKSLKYFRINAQLIPRLVLVGEKVDSVPLVLLRVNQSTKARLQGYDWNKLKTIITEAKRIAQCV